MDKIASDIRLVCLVSIFAGLISAVIPTGRLKGAFSSFCAVAVVFALVSPLGGIRASDLDFSFTDSAKRDEELNSQVESAQVLLYEGMIEAATEKHLAQSGFAVKLIASCTQQGDEIRAVAFTVKGRLDENEKKQVADILQQGFENATVQFEEGEDE